MEFEQFYKGFGLLKYPFGIFTSEAESEVSAEIFIKPVNYSIILEGLRNTSAIITGERGTGKTALSVDLDVALSGGNFLLVRIKEFSPLKEGYSNEDLYRFLIEKIASAFFLCQTESPNSLWKFSKEDRIDLSMYLHNYVGATTVEMLRDKINRIQNFWIKRWSVNCYNFLRVFLNFGLKAATKVASDALTKHFSSIPAFDTGDSEYFQKIKSEVDESFTADEKQFFYLEKLCKLILKTKIEKIYVMIDKIDEDSRFENDAENIADYIKTLCSDNKILTNEYFHTILFVWSTPFNFIKEFVRTQKLSLASLSWDRPDLEKVLTRRLHAYSDGNISNFKEIFEKCNDESMNLLFDMCNSNPRDLWHILNKAFEEQFKIDSSVKLGNDAINAAVNRFVREFNYYEYYPKKASSRSNSMDIYKYIKHLQKLDTDRFTKDKLNTMAGTGGSTSNYVVAMENMGLIRNSNDKAQGGSVVYWIVDPKVRYAMKNGISIGE